MEYRRFLETVVQSIQHKGKGLVYATALLVVLFVVILTITLGNSSAKQSPAALLYRMDLDYTVEVDGLAESRYKAEVHAPSGLKVIEVLVKEGDQVAAGDSLARLDTEALRLDIQRAELNILSAEANMSSEQMALANSVTIARNALASAELSLQSARREYTSFTDRIGHEMTVEVAGINLDAARRAHDYNLSLFEIGGISREMLVQSENTLSKAQTAYDDATRSVEEALDRGKEALEAAEIRYKTSEDTLRDAVQKNTDPAAIALALQKVALQEKQIRLRDADILAPSDGKLTLVNAKQGAPASGLMFIIEDEQELLVRARVGEADIIQIPLDGLCRITPAGQNQAVLGRVAVLPASAERDATGSFSSVIGDDAFYIVDVYLDEPTPEIRIGMNVSVSFVVDTREECFVLPNSLIHKEGDRSSIFTKGTGGRLREIPVSIGLETRRFSEVISDALFEGMEIYSAVSS